MKDYLLTAATIAMCACGQQEGKNNVNDKVIYNDNSIKMEGKSVSCINVDEYESIGDIKIGMDIDDIKKKGHKIKETYSPLLRDIDDIYSIQLSTSGMMLNKYNKIKEKDCSQYIDTKYNNAKKVNEYIKILNACGVIISIRIELRKIKETCVSHDGQRIINKDNIEYYKNILGPCGEVMDYEGGQGMSCRGVSVFIGADSGTTLGIRAKENIPWGT